MRKNLDKTAALELQHPVGMGANPTIVIAVYKRNITLVLQAAGGIAANALLLAVVTRFAVDGADAAIFFNKGDAEETAFGLVDEVAEFVVHARIVVWFGVFVKMFL